MKVIKNSLFLLLGVHLCAFGGELKQSIRSENVCGEARGFVSSWLLAKNKDDTFILSWFKRDERTAVLCVVGRTGVSEKILDKIIYKINPADTFVSDTCTINGEVKPNLFAQIEASDSGDIINAKAAWLFDVTERRLISISPKGVSCTQI